MRIETLKKLMFGMTVSLVMTGGIWINSFAQSRGGGARNTGASGGVRPSGPAGPRREVILVPAGRQRYPTADYPWPTRDGRDSPDVDRSRRDERTTRDESQRHDNEARRQDDRRAADRRSSEDANRFQKLARWLGVSPERLQSFYQEAKQENPDLRLSQFFAAFVIANRLNGSHPSVTPQSILRGLDSGMSLERTLSALGLSAEEIKATVNWAERVVNHLKP